MKPFVLSRKNRLEIYKATLECFKKTNFNDGVCYLLNKEFSKKYPKKDFFFQDVPDLFPEFWAKRPSRIKNPYVGWFPRSKSGREKRIEILEEVIKEMEDGL